MPALLGLAPEVALGIILLSALCGYLALRGVLKGWQFTFGLVLVGLDGKGGIASLLKFGTSIVGHHIGFDFGHYIRSANTAIVNTLQLRIADTEEVMAWTWHRMTQVWQATAEATEWLARETVATTEWLMRSRIPKWSKYAAIPLLLPLLIPKVIRAILPHIHAGTIRTIHTITHTITRVIVHTAVKASHAAIATVLPIPGIRAEIHGLTKRWARLNHRLRKVEALLGVAAMAAAMANVLGLPNWRCLTRGNLGKTARKICGLSAHALDDLLGLIVDVVIVTDICQVIEMLNAGLSIIEGPLQTFVSVAEGALCHGDFSPPPALNVRALSLPPVTGLALSLG